MGLSSVIFLKHRIVDLLNSSDISLDPPSREIFEFAYKELKSSEENTKRVVWRSTTTLALQIMVAGNRLHDVIESHVWKLIVSQSESSTVGIQFLKEEILFFCEQLKKMVECAPQELYYSLPEEEDGDDAVSPTSTGSGGQKSKMVGLSDQYNEVKHKLLTVEKRRLEVLSLVGMPGIGKTTLAKKIFEDPDIVEHFHCHVWVKVGRKCQLKEIPRRILADVNPNNDQILAEGDEDTTQYLKESLKGKRYLIVLDDVWDKYMAYHLQSSYQYGINKFNPFPNEENGSRVLLTTRLQQVDEDCRFPDDVIMMPLLSKEESWDLLREKVFVEESCPSQLDKAGKKIAEHCDGLPLTIVTIAGLLSEAEKTPQYWSEVAAQKNHPLFKAAYDEISKVLLPSFKYLPRLLQMCFLYIGVFPQNYIIPRSKLINMWYVDGFLELNVHKFPCPSTIECLEELVSNSLVMVYERTIDITWGGSKKQIKTCGHHSSLWHLSNREARKAKFCHALNSLDDGLGEGIKGQHRLSFHNNILFGIKVVYESVENSCMSTTHSLLFYGPYHQYQVPICFGLRLLKELDALTIRFYEFPTEVLQLIQLRYLALTLNGKLPASISQLSSLQFLIVGQHTSVKSCRAELYLPVDIWSMKEMQHLQVMGNDLPDPCGASLEKLSTLSNVSALSCTESVLKAIPNLKKLGIQIELTPGNGGGGGGDGKSLRCFDHISHLKQLTSLKCVVVNPDVVPPLAPISIFPPYLAKLSLSGLGYPWKEMSKIASLSCLTVLKLRNYAFRGPKWEVGKGEFSVLSSLVLEDTDLEEWKIGFQSFQRLLYLSIKHCYKLEKIHGNFEMSFENIELIDCNHLSIEEMKNAVSMKTKVSVHSSWDERKLKA